MIETIFSNHWLTWVFSNYSMAFGLSIIVLSTLLKLLAIALPWVPSNQIIDIFKNLFKDATGIVGGTDPGSPPAEPPKE
jgi:hypothetical protein